MATLLAHITVHEGMEKTFEAVAKELFASSHSREDRLRAYEYWRGAEPRCYYVLLSFDDYISFLVHQTSDHHEDASPKLRACMASAHFEWVDPIGGASPNPPTNHQALPEETDDLTRKHARALPAVVQPWWLPLRE